MLTIIVKGTDSCNLNCNYCSLGKKENRKMVSKEKLIEILDYSCRVAKFRNIFKVLFILHGGEPTIVDLEIYEEAIEIIEERYPDIEKEYSIQTNAFNISEDYIRFFEKYNITVGVSIDGSKEIHDLERTNINGEPTYEIVCKNIDRILERGIPVSCLMVLTSNALKEDFEYLNFFAERNLHLKINPLLNYGEVYEHPELSLKREEYARYIINMYEYILKNRISIGVSPIDKLLSAFINRTNIGECTFNPRCNKNFICIDHKGEIYPCGKYSDLKEYRIGNIEDNKLDIFESEIIKKLVARRTDNKPSNCLNCKYVRYCNASCNAEASIDGLINSAPLLCDDYKLLFDYFSGKGLELYKDYLLKYKEELINYELRTSND